jgi:hydroxypyruvate reductase
VTRELVRRAFDAAIDAVDARRATEACLRANPIDGPVELFALGKAALGMSAGAAAACDVRGGIVIAPHGTRDAALPATVEVLRGAHPIPDAHVASRGERWLARAASVPPSTTALVLVSGGGSALVDAPVAGLDAEALADLTRRLLASGASIDELNAVRVALSRSKGGGLARALGGGPRRVLVVNDIAPDGDPSLVASGPMSAWRGTPPSVVIERPHVRGAMRASEIALVERWRPIEQEDARLEVVADNALAVNAAARVLADAGRRVGDGPALIGEARVVGRAWAAAAAIAANDALVAGGETTVTVRGDGRGGRSQELALSALAAGIPGVFLAAGTDGIDGPTDAAGAIVDDAVRHALGDVTIARALERNDSHPPLASCGALVMTGPTGTNVADIAIWTR